MPTNYQPAPIDTAAIRLDRELHALLERLAENTHDNWAMLRLKQGWRWGPKRDDDKKTHPDLVSYAELPESEKDFDRRAAEETLKAIVALGYVIKRKHS